MSLLPRAQLERSRSAPNFVPLASSLPSYRAPARTLIHEDSDPFNMGGFFPRTKSYLNVTKHGHLGEDDEWKWVPKQGQIPAEADIEGFQHEHLIRLTNRTPAVASSLVTPSVARVRSTDSHAHASLPTTPALTLTSLRPAEEDDVYIEDIKNADAFGVLSLTSRSTADVLTRTASAPLTLYTRPMAYEHEHIFHSYDALHGEMRERRRRSYVSPYETSNPNLGRDGTKRKNQASTGMFLFSPKEEDVELHFGSDDEEQDEATEQNQVGGSWGAYLYKKWSGQSVAGGSGSA